MSRKVTYFNANDTLHYTAETLPDFCFDINEKMIQEVKDIMSSFPHNYGRVLSSRAKKDVYEYIFKATACLDQYGFNVTMRTRLYCLFNRPKHFPLCEECNNPLIMNVISLDKGWKRFCNPHCECINVNVQNVLKKTNLQTYGCEQTFQSENNITKSQQKKLELYGDKNFNNSAKSRETFNSKSQDEKDEITFRTNYHKRLRFYDNFLNNALVDPLFTREEYAEKANDKSFKFKWLCKKCGRTFYSPVLGETLVVGDEEILVHARCMKCFPKHYSNCQVQLFDFVKNVIESNCINAHVLHNKKVLKRKDQYPLEIDVFIPEMKIGFEFNGMWFHKYDGSEKSRVYHITKTKIAEDLGIKLVHIWEYEWEQKREETKELIKDIILEKIEFQTTDDILELPRDKFNKCWSIEGFELVRETEPVIIDYDVPEGSVKRKCFDSGKLVYRRVK